MFRCPCYFHRRVVSSVRPRYLTKLAISFFLLPRPGRVLGLVNGTRVAFGGLMFNPTPLHHLFARTSPLCTMSQKVSTNLPLTKMTMSFTYSCQRIPFYSWGNSTSPCGQPLLAPRRISPPVVSAILVLSTASIHLRTGAATLIFASALATLPWDVCKKHFRCLESHITLPHLHPTNFGCLSSISWSACSVCMLIRM